MAKLTRWFESAKEKSESSARRRRITVPNYDQGALDQEDSLVLLERRVVWDAAGGQDAAEAAATMEAGGDNAAAPPTDDGNGAGEPQPQEGTEPGAEESLNAGEGDAIPEDSTGDDASLIEGAGDDAYVTQDSLTGPSTTPEEGPGVSGETDSGVDDASGTGDNGGVVSAGDDSPSGGASQPGGDEGTAGSGQTGSAQDDSSTTGTDAGVVSTGDEHSGTTTPTSGSSAATGTASSTGGAQPVSGTAPADSATSPVETDTLTPQDDTSTHPTEALPAESQPVAEAPAIETAASIPETSHIDSPGEGGFMSDEVASQASPINPAWPEGGMQFDEKLGRIGPHGHLHVVDHYGESSDTVRQLSIQTDDHGSMDKLLKTAPFRPGDSMMKPTHDIMDHFQSDARRLAGPGLDPGLKFPLEIENFIDPVKLMAGLDAMGGDESDGGEIPEEYPDAPSDGPPPGAPEDVVRSSGAESFFQQPTAFSPAGDLLEPIGASPALASAEGDSGLMTEVPYQDEQRVDSFESGNRERPAVE
ncbi:MAG: hypothetical protein V2B18_21070 [Pseudomonadota bacterium]